MKRYPFVAFILILVVLWISTLFYGLGYQGLCGWDNECGIGGAPTWLNYLAGIGAWLGGLVVVLGGFWCAWRIGSGRWSLRSKK